jgi:nitroreductase
VAATRAYDLIRSRRSVYEFEQRPLPEGALARCLEAAVHAPNLGLTQPWRFVVLGPHARGAVAERARELETLRPGTAPGLRAEAPLRGAAEVVAVLRRRDARAAVRRADLLALGAAVQNMLLCAWDEGFAGLWLGAPLAGDAGVRAAVEAAADEDVVALVALGYPEAVPPAPRRRRAAECTRHVP